MIYQDEVIILKEIPYKENDKILHALSKTNGRIQLIAKGCKKNNSHLINVSQIFAYSKCSLYKSKDMYIIDSAELIESFYNIRNDMDSFIYANYILELINYVAQENQIDEKVFNMTVKMLKCLSVFKNDFDKLTSAYELKLVSMLGYKPDFNYCISCGGKIKGSAIFSIVEGGFYCLECKCYSNGINIEYSEILTLDRILKTKFEDISSLKSINRKIINIIRQFLFYYIGKNNFTSLKLLETSNTKSF